MKNGRNMEIWGYQRSVDTCLKHSRLNQLQSTVFRHTSTVGMETKEVTCNINRLTQMTNRLKSRQSITHINSVDWWSTIPKVNESWQSIHTGYTVDCRPDSRLYLPMYRLSWHLLGIVPSEPTRILSLGKSYGFTKMVESNACINMTIYIKATLTHAKK